jgi:hypothetical protein
LYRSDLLNGVPDSNPVEDSTPLSPQPDSVGPARVEDYVGVGSLGLAPQDAFAELEPLFADRFAEQPVVPGPAVFALHILGYKVGNVLY